MKIEDYNKQLLFDIDEDVYRKLEERRMLAKKMQNRSNVWKVKTDKRNILGDGIPEKVGYNLSSVWTNMRHQHADIYPYSIELPINTTTNEMYSTSGGIRYSRTNLEEINRIIKTYMRGGEYFLENTCGWSTFGTMAAYNGFNGIGCDIWDVAIEYSNKQYEAIKHLPGIGNYEVIKADGMSLPFENESFDFVYCNPPFMDVELYSGEENDIADSNIELFREKFNKLLSENKRVLKKEQLCIITIGDYRKNGILKSMLNEVLNEGCKVGFQLHDLVIAENAAGKALMMRKREYKYRRTAKSHEYVIVFKGK